jgi:hypothetical protein
MLRQLAATLAATARQRLNRGLVALAWVLGAAGLATAGLGMLVAAALIALSRLMGPLLACGLMGLILLLLALLIAARLRSRPVLPPPRTLTPDELAFSIGFAIARMVLGKRP